MSIAADLNKNLGKGAALFQKRKARSEKWVIDENNVKKPGHQPTSSYIGVCHFIMIYFNMESFFFVFVNSQQLNHGVNMHQHRGLAMKDLLIQGLAFRQLNRNLNLLLFLLHLNPFFHLHRRKMFQDLEILMLNQKVLVLGMQKVTIFVFLTNKNTLFLIIRCSTTITT
jgi:hypothetical protein